MMGGTGDLSIDFETASTADLKRTGSRAYAAHPDTRVLCMAYAFGNGPVQVWKLGEPFPSAVTAHVFNGGIVRAWNAAFEFDVWNLCLTRQPGVATLPLSLNNVRDTMAQAAYYGLPLSLDMAGQALHLPVQKDKAGHALMLRMCRPRSTAPLTWWHETDPQKYADLIAYCKTDVEVERAIADRLPQLPAKELSVWQLDRRMNLRGVALDRTLVEELKAMSLLAAADANAEMSRLTAGNVPAVTSAARLLKLLRLVTPYPYTDLKKDNVVARLDDPNCWGLERTLLELRADTAKTSAAKLDSMLSAVMSDGRVRGMLQYYGASRTGRWAGRLIQMQNLPRGELKPAQVVDAVNRLHPAPGNAPAFLRGVLETVFRLPVMRVIASLLRSCIVAPKGKTLVVADLAQIEARVIAWLAGQADILAVFASGQDVYCYTAGKVSGRTVTKEDPLRQLGKVLVLACGFGMSGTKFLDAAATYGITLTLAEAKDAVRQWRAANAHIVQFWWDLDAAARRVLSGGGIEHVGRFIKLGMWGDTLVMSLPSGRGLFYREARLEIDPASGDEQITYMGVDQYTKKWSRQKTYGGKLAENATQAVARDVMADALLAADQHPLLEPVLSIHDEGINLADDTQADAALAALLGIMKTTPAWAPGLPVGAEGWHGPRYMKK